MIDQKKIPLLRCQDAMDDSNWHGHTPNSSADYGIGSKAVNFLRLFSEIHDDLELPYNQLNHLMQEMQLSPIMQRALCLCLASDFTLESLRERSEIGHVDS